MPIASVCENILGEDLQSFFDKCRGMPLAILCEYIYMFVGFFFDKCRRMPQVILCEYILGEESPRLQEFLPTQGWAAESGVGKKLLTALNRSI